MGTLSSISPGIIYKEVIQGHKWTLSRPSTNLSELSQGHKVTCELSQSWAPTYQSGHIPRVGVITEVKQSGGLVQKSCKQMSWEVFLGLLKIWLQKSCNQMSWEVFSGLLKIWLHCGYSDFLHIPAEWPRLIAVSFLSPVSIQIWRSPIILYFNCQLYTM